MQNRNIGMSEQETNSALSVTPFPSRSHIYPLVSPQTPFPSSLIHSLLFPLDPIYSRLLHSLLILSYPPGFSGLGLMVGERLLSQHPDIHICLACRNKKRAQEAAQHLLKLSPEADITLLLVDISSLESVYRAAAELKKRYDHIDYLFLNAGIMPVSTLNWKNLINGLFSSNCLHILTTGEGLLKQVDGVTTEGLQQIFTTNLFGHFILLKELLHYNLGGQIASQIIWTSSSNAKPSAFSLEDIQHKHGFEPYSSSKYASDVLSVALNNKHNQQGVYSHSVCPGLVMTNLTYGILPAWIWSIFFPIFCLFRLFVPSLNLSAYNGSEALLWCTEQLPEGLDPLCKYRSCSTVFGGTYVQANKLSVPLELADSTYKRLDEMEREMRAKYRPADL